MSAPTPMSQSESLGVEMLSELKTRESFRGGLTWFLEEGDEDHDEGQPCQDAYDYGQGPPHVILRIIFLAAKENQTIWLE